MANNYDVGDNSRGKYVRGKSYEVISRTFHAERSATRARLAEVQNPR